MGCIDQARGQDGWILASFFFCLFMDRDGGQYPAILTEKAWSIEDLLFGFWRKFFCWTWQSYLACSGSQSQCVIWSILPAHRASHIII